MKAEQVVMESLQSRVVALEKEKGKLLADLHPSKETTKSGDALSSFCIVMLLLNEFIFR